jgi:hypothetical protein
MILDMGYIYTIRYTSLVTNLRFWAGKLRVNYIQRA